MAYAISVHDYVRDADTVCGSAAARSRNILESRTSAGDRSIVPAGIPTKGAAGLGGGRPLANPVWGRGGVGT
jgi:hypothetical protein